MIEELFSFLGEDSDSECHTSSTEDSPQAGPPSGGARAPQKRERPRKKPAPQAPRNVAIPVAMPKAPAVIPPRLPPPPQVRTPAAESEQGEILQTYRVSHQSCHVLKHFYLIKQIY